VLLIAGALRWRKETISVIWPTDETIRHAVFTTAMARNRFAHILQFIRFDDKSTRVRRRANDKLADIRDVSDRFVENFKKLFESFEEMTVDEHSLEAVGLLPLSQNPATHSYLDSDPSSPYLRIPRLEDPY
jgi:hypothetical protein